MSMDVVLAPDIYVNASVSLGSPPEHIVRRALGGENRSKTSKWVLERVESMLLALPEFKASAVGPQMATIRDLVDVVETSDFYIEDWEPALIALAKAARVAHVVTDHPDLLAAKSRDGVEFVASEKWLVQQTTPPPPPKP